MAFSVRDEATDAAVRRLAKFKNQSLTETIRQAVEEEYRRAKKTVPLAERIRAIQDEVARYPRTGLKADKAFYDELSGD